jgi:nitrogen fixation NifU-like protein
MPTGYNNEVMAHFLRPRNVGIIEDADGIGRLGDADCGDVFMMFVRVREGRLEEIKYLVQGCGAAIATCSALTEIAKGKSIAEAKRLTDDDIARALGGLPLEKLHCSNMAATVLHLAIKDYEQRSAAGEPPYHVEYEQGRPEERPA